MPAGEYIGGTPAIGITGGMCIPEVGTEAAEDPASVPPSPFILTLAAALSICRAYS